jgi:hypothetical protein
MLITTKTLGGTNMCKNHCNIKCSKGEHLTLQKSNRLGVKIEHL